MRPDSKRANAPGSALDFFKVIFFEVSDGSGKQSHRVRSARGGHA
jgi:hypothetical protein